jgi:hypothetical protein
MVHCGVNAALETHYSVMALSNQAKNTHCSIQTVCIVVNETNPCDNWEIGAHRTKERVRITSFPPCIANLKVSGKSPLLSLSTMDY